MVRPMERITRSMVAFRSNPEDYASDVPDAGRRDEIGTAVRELASMKAGLRQALRQQTRLATLGTAVNKINHDLRNMLSTATMISDRLSDSADPDVRRVAPTLIRAIDRAARLCLQTLNFTRDTPALQIDEVPLADLLGDLRGMFEADGGQPLGIEFDDRDTTVVRVDRDQIHRVFANLARNAAAAGAGCLSVSASSQAGRVRITIADDGPGIPPAAHDKLFRPFLYSTAADGYGLGLAIARDIAQAHGGRLALLRSDKAGTAFMLELPQVQAATPPPEPEPAVAQQA
jgi:signal transduction histidine kinase